MPPFVVIADPSDPRVRAWEDACAALSLPRPHVVSYADVVAHLTDPGSLFSPGATVRIDSPGRAFATYRALLKAGIPSCIRQGIPVLSVEQVDALPERHGEILAPGQWFEGMRAVLGAMAKVGHVHLPMAPNDIVTMFDKPVCHRTLHQAGIRVPKALASVMSYEGLTSVMDREGISRVFVKLRYGSSAAGMVAYQRMPGKEMAYTTAEQEGDCLFATRRVRRLTRSSEIAELIDRLCSLGVHVEQWIPKVGVNGSTCDLRVVSINRQPFAMVVRSSHGPFTNLHLGGFRGHPAILRDRTSPEVWQALISMCSATHSLFPSSVQASLDVAITPAFRSAYVLEVNAFGDYIKLDDSAGATPQQAQVSLLLGKGEVV